MARRAMAPLARRLAPAAALALALGCSGDATGPDRQDVLRHLQRWQAQGLADYSFQFRRGCFCYYEPAVVEVRGGQVARVVSISTGQPVAPDAARLYPTIDQVFDDLLREQDAPHATLKVRWDEQRGNPTSVSYHTDIPDVFSNDSISDVTPLPTAR
jgi:hypothetical protein